MNRSAAARDERAKTIDELAYDYEMAKQAVAYAKTQLDAAEAALVAAVPCELEGSLTTEGDYYRVVTTGRLIRTIDVKKLDEIRALVPAAIFSRVFKFSPELSVRDYRFVENNEPEIFKVIAEAVTAKPGKTGLKVERLVIEE